NSFNDVVVDQMHQPWRTFAALINRGLSGKTSGLDKLRLSRDKTLSWRNKIGMHTSKDDYLTSTLRFISAKESTQIYRAIPLECLTNPAMKESKAYKTYLGYATCVVPPKIARKFKKISSSKKGIVIREPPVETKSKRKEKMDVTRGKGIELLFEVALTEEAQMKEVRKKSLRDFHKLHPICSGIVTEKPPRVDKITPPITSEGTGNDDENKSDDDKTPSDNEKDSDSKQDIDGSELDSESDQQEYEEEVKDDDDEFKDDDEDDDDDDDKSEGDEDRGMDSDDVQNKKDDIEIIDAQQEKENLKMTQEQVVEDAHVTITNVVKETEVPDASDKDVAELKKDPLHTQVTALVDDHLDTRMGATREEFMNFLLASLTDRIIEQVRNQLPHILPKEVSNFAPPVIGNMITESLNQQSRQDKDKDEGHSAGSD
nr:hypothetical protein [Tanacetum cinerariifolium]